jgi:hypothetical protein
MPLSYEFADSLVILRVSGTVDNEDHRTVFGDVVADDGFVAGTNVLLFDTGGKYSPSAAEALELVRIIKSYQDLGLGRFAVIVTGVFHWAVGRMMAAYAANEGVEFRVFRNEAVAKRWLNE